MNKHRKRVVLLVVLAALIAASASYAGWVWYSANASGSGGGATDSAQSTVGAFLLTPCANTQKGSNTSPASDVCIHALNQSTASHSFDTTGGLTVSSITTSNNAGCPFSTLSGTTLTAVGNAINNIVATQTLAGGASHDYDVLNAFQVLSTAPVACVGISLTVNLSGTLDA